MLDNLVICRIGSLEIADAAAGPEEHVICRIGSLEKKSICTGLLGTVICRIGSLEIVSSKERAH